MSRIAISVLRTPSAKFTAGQAARVVVSIRPVVVRGNIGG